MSLENPSNPPTEAEVVAFRERMEQFQGQQPGTMPVRLKYPAGASDECMDCHDAAYTFLVTALAASDPMQEPGRSIWIAWAYAEYLRMLNACPCGVA